MPIPLKVAMQGGGTVCELPNDYSTLEFEKALKDLSVGNYGSLKQRIRNQIMPVIAELREQHQRNIDEFRKDKQLSAVHRSVKRLYPYQTVSSVMHIIGTSLNGQRRNDRVMYRVRSMCRQRIAQSIGDIVIEVPEDYSLILEDLQPNVHVLPEKMTPSFLSEMEERWCPGASMSEAEMSEVVSRFPEPGFQRYGWRASNIPSAHYYGVLVTRRKRGISK